MPYFKRRFNIMHVFLKSILQGGAENVIKKSILDPKNDLNSK